MSTTNLAIKIAQSDMIGKNMIIRVWSDNNYSKPLYARRIYNNSIVKTIDDVNEKVKIKIGVPFSFVVPKNTTITRIDVFSLEHMVELISVSLNDATNVNDIYYVGNVELELL